MSEHDEAGKAWAFPPLLLPPPPPQPAVRPISAASKCLLLTLPPPSSIPLLRRTAPSGPCRESPSIGASRWLMQARTGATVAPAPKWRNWQTRRTQNPVRETSCGFESHLRHLEAFGSTKPRRRGSSIQELPHSEDTQLLAQIESLYRARFADFVAVAASIVGERD